MSDARSAALRVGLAGGAMFFLHGLVDGSRSWPYVWPALAGALACWLGSRGASPHAVRRGLGAALTAGALAGVVGFVGATITVAISARSAPIPAGGRPLVTLAAEFGIAVACLAAVVAAVLGGAVTAPVWWLRQGRPGAPTMR